MEKVVQAFQKQKEYRWDMALSSAKMRIDMLKKLRKNIFAKRQKIYQALLDDFSKNFVETELTEIQPVISEINFHIKNLHKWVKPHKVRTPLMLLGTKSYVVYEPRGVVLIISPWNYPFNLSVLPTISAISAGNCVILKPSEYTPATSRILQELFADSFEENIATVIEGDSEVAASLTQAGFDHIFFTGSTTVGKRVAESAAKHLSSLTLELGGKSPVILDQTADIKKAAKRITWGKFLNAGQTCIAPDYVLLPDTLFSSFIAEIQQVIQDFYGRTPEERKSSKDFCRIVNSKHFLRLRNLLDSTVRKGAIIECGGDVDPTENYIPPTVISNIDLQSEIMQEEIFGPLLPIITYKQLHNAIDFIKERAKPLALYVFSNSRQNIQTILQKTTAGSVCVNNIAIQAGNPYLPFGGVNSSGIGSYHGFHGFKEFSHAKSVMYQGKLSGISMVYPPYTKFVQNLSQLITNKLS